MGAFLTAYNFTEFYYIMKCSENSLPNLALLFLLQTWTRTLKGLCGDLCIWFLSHTNETQPSVHLKYDRQQSFKVQVLNDSVNTTRILDTA